MAIATREKPKQTHQHKRRHGAHQKRSNHFMKAYWPYLPMLLLVVVVLAFNNAWVQRGVLGYATEMTQGGLLTSTNTQRVNNGVQPLSLNSTLSQAAQAKANDMIARNYWSHNTPDGQQPWIFIDQSGYKYEAAGENLAYGFVTSGDAVTGWMNSPGHRANILNGNFVEVGFGIANSPSYQNNGEQTIVVAMYGKPLVLQASTEQSQTPATQPTTQPDTANTKPDESSQQPIAAERDETSQKLQVSAVVPEQKKIANVQVQTSGSAPWSIYVVSTVALVLLALFIIRHSYAWHRILVRGENFVVRHKALDALLLASLVAAAILAQTAGYIQ